MLIYWHLYDILKLSFSVIYLTIVYNFASRYGILLDSRHGIRVLNT